MIVRPAKEEDVPALLEIYNYEVIHGTATLDLNQRTLPEWKEWFREHQTDDHFILTAEIDGVTAGYASLSEYRSKEAYKSTAELSVYVGHEFRRQGVASALIEEVLKRARSTGGLHSVVSVITAGNARQARDFTANSASGHAARCIRWASSMGNTRISTTLNLSWVRSNKCSVR